MPRTPQWHRPRPLGLVGVDVDAGRVFVICTAVSGAVRLPLAETALRGLSPVGMALYAVASIVLAAGESAAGFPAVSDVFSWALYPFALAAIWRLRASSVDRSAVTCGSTV